LSSGIAVSITEDDLLGGAVRLCQPERGYRVTSDAVILAALTPVIAGQRVLELGTGYGQVALCLLAREPSLQVTGLELMEEAAALARHNAALNHREDLFSVVIGSVVDFDGAGGFDVVVSNPPYRTARTHTASPDPLKAAATVLQQPLALWVACARRALKPEGKLVMILDARQEAEALAACTRNALPNVQILPLLSFDAAPAKRIVLHASSDAIARVTKLSGLVLHHANGSWRPELVDVLAKAGALDHFKSEHTRPKKFYHPD
jgi:tRNA1(Val) A37 N6-methylase TrmN6